MKNLKIFVAATCLALGFTACELDRFPKNSLASDKSLQSIEDARRWNSGHMAQLRAVQYGAYFSLADKQADFLQPKADFGNQEADFYRFDIKTTDYDTRDIWAAYYARLININEFLARVPKMEPSVTLSRYVADAHFIRAYYYTELMKRYAPAYNATTAASELGVPLVTEFDVKARPARSPQAVIYKFIQDDIATAKAEYAKAGIAPGTPGANVLTPDALDAFEVRVLLQMNEFAKAFEIADALIKTGRYPLGKDKAAFEAMWRADNSTEDIVRFSVNKDEPSEAPFSVGGYYGATVVQGYPVLQPYWLPAQGMIDKYDEKDVRKAVYFETIPTGAFLNIAGNFYRSSPGGPIATLSLISKYRGNPALAAIANDPAWGGPRPDGRMAPKFIRIAEVYLAAAEAAYKSGKTSDAQKYLSDFRQSRGLDAVTSSGEALYTAIQDEYQREFLAEGRRLWDLKRWGLGFTRLAPNEILAGNNLIINHNRTLVVPADHHCFTWPIPQDDMKTNPNLKGQQNKGY